MDVGVIIDLETTGFDPLQDRVVEVGMLEFVLTAAPDAPPGAGLRADMVGAYSGLEDPGQPLAQGVADLTGLSDAVLAGRVVDWDQVRQMLSRASVVIAHNAAFDRSFLERRPELAGLDLHWACSIKHINWHRHGFRTRALNYLAADHGFVNPFAHRALFDCATTFRLVTPYMEELIRRSHLREFLVSATGSPFETKDILRAQGYRWNPDARVWAKAVLEDELDEERAFLAAEVYKGASRHREEEVGGGA
jgi:DNA polymerase-3 subunit epsilon